MHCMCSCLAHKLLFTCQKIKIMFNIKNARALGTVRNKKVPGDTKKPTILKAYTETQENQCH